MLSQKELSKLDAVNASITYRSEDWIIIVQSPTRLDTVDWIKQFWLSTYTFNTLSEYINHFEWTFWWKKLEVKYIPEDDYENKLFERILT